MDNKEIAKELAVACLSHDKFALLFEPQSTKKPDAAEAGERVGEFYNTILKALEEEQVKSAKPPQVHQF